MGFMDKAKELATKADQAINELNGPNSTKEAEALYRDLGSLVFVREQGRSSESTDADIDSALEKLRALEARVGSPLAAAAPEAAEATPPPPPPGAAAAALAGIAPPPPGQQSATASQTPPPPPAPSSGSVPPPPRGSW